MVSVGNRVARPDSKGNGYFTIATEWTERYPDSAWAGCGPSNGVVTPS